MQLVGPVEAVHDAVAVTLHADALAAGAVVLACVAASGGSVKRLLENFLKRFRAIGKLATGRLFNLKSLLVLRFFYIYIKSPTIYGRLLRDFISVKTNISLLLMLKNEVT